MFKIDKIRINKIKKAIKIENKIIKKERRNLKI
jgi:hypothetical protein